jgi:hypothetical protein
VKKEERDQLRFLFNQAPVHSFIGVAEKPISGWKLTAESLKQLLDQVDELEEALEFYDCENNWHEHDVTDCKEFSCAHREKWRRARAALKRSRG